MQITATSNSPGILVLNDSWHPNWSVTVDGAPGYIGRVDEAFRGVVLPAGRHVVEMRYAPRSLAIARGISFAALLLILALCVFRGKIDARLRRRLAPTPGQRKLADLASAADRAAILTIRQAAIS